MNDQIYYTEFINSLKLCFMESHLPTVEVLYNQSRPTYFIFYS